MVSFHTPLSPTGRKATPETGNSSRKRKWEEEAADSTEGIVQRPPNAKTMKWATFDTELHLDTPLPSEWQQCLDIKSGQMHYYNTSTNTRKAKDSTRAMPPNPSHMSLNLELNLPGGSPAGRKDHAGGDTFTMRHSSLGSSLTCADHRLSLNFRDHQRNIPVVAGGDPVIWLAFEGDGDEKEMVTAVCRKCHMLVMMCKASPACPNCKFMHPPDQSRPTF